MKEKKEINVVNDQYGSPTYAADLAEAIMQIIERLYTHYSPPDSYRDTTHRGIYHFSNKGIVTWYDFAIAIKELAGLSCRINPIATDKYPAPAKRPAYSGLDKTKIQETFGINLKNWKNSLGICFAKIKNVS